MMDETSPKIPTGSTQERQLDAVSEAEHDPETAMAEGIRDRSTLAEPTQPVDPTTHEPGENYLGEETIFTRRDSDEK